MILPWIILLLMTLSECTVFTDQPRLESTDGKVNLIGAKNSNIVLQTTGRGRITLNGNDIRGVIEDANAAARRLQSKDSALSLLQKDVEAMISEENKIKERLAACEANYKRTDVKIEPQPDMPVSARDKSQINNLSERVWAIERNLNLYQCIRLRPCRNGGRCIERYFGYLCLCPEGWEGIRCHRDVNECSRFRNTDLGCQNGAKCVNLRGSYNCKCPPGFYGKHCTKTANACDSGSSSDFCDHGICVQAHNKTSYKCICDQGWKKIEGGETCSEDVDECLVAPCSRTPKVNCLNIPGSFRCESCPIGYTGNGHTCEDIDECLTNNGGCSTSPIVSCMNTVGSFRCGACPPGYAGDGKVCNYVGKCNTDHGGCHPQATCQEIGLSVVCTCVQGYIGNGIGRYGCVPTVISAAELPNSCTTNPCKNGRCLQTTPTTYTCYCNIGFSGNNCEITQSPCASSPCANGGTCIARGQSFRCRCASAFTGPLCKDERLSCGGYLSGDEGVLEFPATGSNQYYRPSLSCAWRIKVNSSMTVKATFDSFDLQPSNSNSECVSDWLKIYDGKEVGHHNLIGKYCGNKLPNNGTIISTGNNLALWFRSDNARNYKGFKLYWNITAPECGGNLDGQVHGSFSSPGGPGPYPQNRDCYWTVSTYFGQRITFTFFLLQLENHRNCSNDYLEFRDGASSGLIGRYCTSGNPTPLVSSSNTVVIHFHSDNISSDKGFQIGYHPVPGIPGCGGILTELKGEIKPAVNNNGEYLDNLNCVWLIRGQEDSKIKLTVHKMELEEYEGLCEHDFLEIRYGSSLDAPLHGRFCGSDAPEPMTSPANTMLVRFKSDRSLSYSGFRISYEQVCSKTFSSQSGYISSPNYPSDYPNSTECSYTISQPIGKAIRLDFQDFAVEDLPSLSSECFYDYLQIHDGPTSEYPVIVRACGVNRPNKIISKYNQMHLKFHTDSTKSYRGWSANYSVFDVGYGGVLTTASGKISSPSHMEGYPPNVDFHWIIHVQNGYRIQLSFLSFHLENSYNCQLDYVSIYDNSTNGELIGKFCGGKLPAPLTSSGNILTVVFKTDSSRGGDGFQLQYNSIDASQVCGGNHFQSQGVLKSPNYPKNYPSDKQCIWVIKVADGQRVRLQITNFSLEATHNCMYDRLEIRNGPKEVSPRVGSYCGSNRPPPTILSMTNAIYIKLYTDSLKESTGFMLHWDSAIVGCGGALTGSSGSLESPNYPEPYPNNLECFYNIRTSAGSKIELIFVDLDLEDDSCNHDYIQVYDGPDKRSKSLGTFCNNPDSAPSLISSSNKLFIKFRSDRIIGGRGFKLRYKSVCNVLLTGSLGVIESLEYPQPFDGEKNCSWTILASPGHNIDITFTEVQFSNEYEDYSYDEDDDVHRGTCDKMYSHLEMVDCSGNNPLSMGTLCKETSLSLKTFSSPGERFCLNFYQKPWLPFYFRLEWAENGCGGRLTKAEDSFSFPENSNDAERYSSVLCNWQIIIEENKGIILIISDINILSESCSQEALTIYGGEDETSPILTKICTPHVPVQLQSSANKMLISFKTNLHNSRKRFSVAYYSSIQPNDCGGTFTALSGSISADKSGTYSDCTWTIQADNQHRVQLKFVALNVVYNANCSSAYVEVFDGPDHSFETLGRYCGNQTANPTLVSTGRSLAVRLYSSSLPVSNGFKAEYLWTCGATINVEEPGIFVPRAQQNNSCSVIFLAPQSDGHVTLSVLWQAQGSMVSVEIFDGEDENSTLLGKVENGDPHFPFTSLGNVIVAKTNFPAQVSGHIEISYSSVSSSCGGLLTGFSGKLASPNYPRSYPNGIECIWQIPVTIGNKMQLSFKSFDLQGGDFCDFDYVEIRNYSSQGALIGTYCGNNIPITITSDGGFWIKFSSNSDGIVANGFLVDFSWVFANEIIGNNGSIANPFYPKSLIKQSIPMSWRITVEPGEKIDVTFTEFSNDPRCTFFKFQIFDGYDSNAAEKQYCRYTTPEPFVSTSNVILITVTPMKFDNALYKSGIKFYFTWREIVAKREIWRLGLGSANRSPACGEEWELSKSNKSVTIVFPSSPSSPYTNCNWIIRAPQGHHLGYRMQEIHLKEFVNCAYESVKVYSDNRLIKKYCLHNETHISWDLVEVQDVLSVTFTPFWIHSGERKSGFKMEVVLVPGGKISASEGTIEFNSSADSVGASINLSYLWQVRVGRGRKINVNFDEFAIVANNEGSCSDQYVMLRNGYNSDSPLLGKGKYCGTLPTSIPITTSNELFVKLYNRNVFLKGLKLKLRFREVKYTCGGRLELSEDTKYSYISTPNYPNSPPPKLECIWLIVAPLEKTIQLDFVGRFDLYYSESCSTEYVEVRDGASSLAGQLGKFCSDEPPGSLRSSDHLLYIKYYTNATEPNNGFRATVSIDHCGGVVRAWKGTISTAGYPELPTGHLNCTWTIRTSPNSILRLNFTDFNLPNRTNGEHAEYLAIDNNWDILATIMSLKNFVVIYEEGLRFEDGKENFLRSLHFNNTKPKLLGQRVISPRLLGIFYDGQSLVPMSSTTSVVHVTLFTDIPVNSHFRGFQLHYDSEASECHHELSTADGVIEFPHHPTDLSMAINCQWNIRVNFGRRISATIEEFGLTDTGAIHLFNDDNLVSRIGILTRRTPPTAVYKSSGNTMIIYFNRGHARSSYEGFRIRYSSDEAAACGGVLIGNEEIIETPSNMTSFDCIWKLQVPTNVNVSHFFSIEKALLGNQTKSCGYRQTSGLFIKSGEGNAFTHALCGAATGIIGIPNGNIVISAVQADHGSTPVTLRLKYKQSNCGGVVSANMLPYAISSPLYPELYSPGTDCAWRVSTSTGQTLKVTFEEFQLESSCHDYLSIRSGPTFESPLIAKYCGVSRPEKELVSVGEDLYIVFHSVAGNGGKGFKLLIQNNHTECGGLIHGDWSEITSPNYPGKYDNNMECEWEIRTDFGNHIYLSFPERFQLETSNLCVNDSLQIIDYAKNATPISICGRYNPGVNNYNSSGNSLTLKFRSNEAVVGDGFKARWEAKCGAVLVTPSGTLSSPYFPGYYPNNLDCEYHIISNSETVFVTLTYLDLEPPKGSKCIHDYVDFYKIKERTNEQTSKKLIKRLCGNELRNLTISGNVLVHFHSDSSNTFGGFQFTYSVEKCGGLILQPTLLEYSTIHRNIGTECSWHIKAPKDLVVSVLFTDTSLSWMEWLPCSHAKLSVLDPALNFSTIAHICGIKDQPISLISTSNEFIINLKVLYRSSFVISFKAVISHSLGPNQGCGGNLTITDKPKIIQSPDWNNDGRYDDFLDCKWVVEAPESHYISIKFLSLDVDSCNTTDCSCDSVQIRNGIGPLSDLIENVCGKIAPVMVTSSSNVAWIQFHTDGSYSGSGFKIELSSQLSPCNKGRLIANNELQRFSSPNYPNSYPNNIRCAWHIFSELPPNATFNGLPMTTWLPQIHIRILNWDIEETPNCNNDYISVEMSSDIGRLDFNDSTVGPRQVPLYEGTKKNVNSYFVYRTFTGRSRYCGSGRGADFYATSGQAIVRFVSNQAVSGNGFTIEYSTRVCGRHFSAPNGRIKFEHHFSNETCYVTVQAAQNHTISLYFNLFSVRGDGKNCNNSYLKVVDGPDSWGNEILLSCGFSRRIPIFSQGQNLFIEFMSSSLLNEVDITYTTTDRGQGCGGEIFNTVGSFTSPFFPNIVNISSVCEWRIFVPEGLKINMKFTAFDLGSLTNSTADCVEIFDIDDSGSTSTINTRLCSGDEPEWGSIQGSGNAMTVKSTRSVDNRGTGWAIKFFGLAPGYSVSEVTLF